MIKKIIENSITFSARKDNKDKLVIVLHEKELPKIRTWEVLHVNLNSDKKIEINVIENNESIINYEMPYNAEVFDLIYRYNLTHIDVYYAFENEEKAMLVFDGILKGIGSLIQ